ncbi:MAG TPA: hypothetical protein VK658_26050 [Chryseolinea sp.]|nr:hypothetical protein [Chryseolinea sp.]
MFLTTPATCIVLLLIAAHFATAQDKHDHIERIMKTYHAFNMFEGSVLVAEQGKVSTRVPLDWQTAHC